MDADGDVRPADRAARHRPISPASTGSAGWRSPPSSPSISASTRSAVATSACRCSSPCRAVDRHADPQRDRHHRAVLARRVLAATGAAAAAAGADHAGRRRRRPGRHRRPRGDDPRRHRRQRPQRRQLALPRSRDRRTPTCSAGRPPCCTSGAWRSRSSSTSSSACSPCSSPGAARRPVRVVFVVAVATAVASFVVPIVAGAGVDRIYYGSDTRAGELMVGVAAAAVLVSAATSCGRAGEGSLADRRRAPVRWSLRCVLWSSPRREPSSCAAACCR